MKYFFTLGSHPQLSITEIKAVLNRLDFTFEKILTSDSIIIFDCQKKLEPQILNQLGGAIKFGEILTTAKQVQPAEIFELLKPTDKKFYLGLSSYDCKIKLLNLGLEIKKLFKENGLSYRYVSSKENPLSSVVVEKNNLTSDHGAEIIIIGNKGQFFIGQTLAVQDFENYSKLDFGRPARDDVSGMLPPKVAQIMVNLSEQPLNAIILDPFCGSGTILQMAAVLGYKNLIGLDKSAKAIADSKTNLTWFENNFNVKTDLELKKIAVENLSDEIKPDSVDAIVTEPYLGPALKGFESISQIEKNINELKKLYATMFKEFFAVLKKSGRVVVIIPEFQVRAKNLTIDISDMLKNKFKIVEKFIYSREGQKVKRNIYVLQK
jgi:tRNA G10  N-methylase Trm11